MSRATRSSYALIVLAISCPGAAAPIAAENPPDQTPVRELTLSPAAVPVPLFRYRLLPLSSDLNPGNAAPIYLRLRYEYEAPFTKGQENLMAWLQMPLDKLPIQKARQWGMRDRMGLLALGARRDHCDWAYPLAEQRQEAFDILLPDVQSMRVWGRYLALKARLDIAEHKYSEAVITLETGIAFSRHVASAPFLINSLVGIAICNGLVDQIEELVQQPLSPNLYWALTALPQPLISTRQALEFERRMPEDMVPEFRQLDDPKTPAEWSVLLGRMYANLRNLAVKLQQGSPDERVDATAKALVERPLEAFRQEAAPRARAALATALAMTPDRVKAMSDDEVLCRSLVARYHEVQDRLFKAIYLTYPDAISALREVESSVKDTTLGPLQMVNLLRPAVSKSLASETRLDRRFAMLRIIEALRLHASTNDGKLPRTLSQLTEVPLPVDPATGKPFDYHIDNGGAILSGPAAGIDIPATKYRISIRSKDVKGAP